MKVSDSLFCDRFVPGFHKALHCVAVHLQEVHAAGAGGRGDPDEAESGGGLVTDVRGHHAADELGSSELPLGHHTWTGHRRRNSASSLSPKSRFSFLDRHTAAAGVHRLPLRQEK